MNQALTVYRDDGQFAVALAKLGRHVPVPSAVFAVLGALLVLVPALLAGEDADESAAGAAVIWGMLIGGLATGRAETGSFRWLVPPAIRLTEYAGLLWLGAVAGGSGVPAAFALICALAFRHYDLVYRLRHRGVTPPAWVDNIGLGWDGRLFVGVLLLEFGALPAGFFILAGIFAAVFVTESVAGWTGTVRSQETAVYEEEEDEGQ
ncbi:MAG TPA: DUF5941 domain-containing protein [Solirubrobacteraceae bacterium]|jgi:hypothetical protein